MENASAGMMTVSGIHLQVAKGRPGPSWHVFLPLFPLQVSHYRAGIFKGIYYTLERPGHVTDLTVKTVLGARQASG